MLEDRDGSPNHTHVHLYRAGEVYSRETVPPASDDLMAGFVASGHALEVDAHGNPVGTPADARARKAAWVAEVAALMGPADAPALAAEEDAPAPASESDAESAAQDASGAVAVEAASDSLADAEASGEPVEASQGDDPGESDASDAPKGRGRR